MCDFVQRKARTAAATRARARQHPFRNALRVPQGELLRHHPAERHTDDPNLAPADRVEQTRCIVGVVLNRVRTGRFVRPPQATLVVTDGIERGRSATQDFSATRS
jgi:hypothetical protein